jgi:hypothetical protein
MAEKHTMDEAQNDHVSQKARLGESETLSMEGVTSTDKRSAEMMLEGASPKKLHVFTNEEMLKRRLETTELNPPEQGEQKRARTARADGMDIG